MSRDALVVGISSYAHLPHLKAPAGDAEAIAHHLETYGDFQVRRLPAYTDPFEENARRVAANQEVSLAQLKQALVNLFKPESQQVPETALLYFSGHGIRDMVGVAEGYLATSDVNPQQEFFGLSLRWLRRLLAESEVRQQVIWLDCCYSGEILNVAEAYPGEGRDRCFIAASRDFEVAYEEVGSARSVLTAALLEGLQPGRYGDRPINNTLLTDHINEALKGATQRSVCYNSGSPILLTSPWVAPTPAVTTGDLPEDCPYKGLNFFDCNDHDPQYFFGRQRLVDQLLDEVRPKPGSASNFLAIVGASGSGKSSVLRAGLLHQLKRGQRLQGSDTWDIRLFLPGEHPLQSLAQVFVEESDIRNDLERQSQLKLAEEMIADGAAGLQRWMKGKPETFRLVLAIDQFEEVFTLCQQPAEREQFFALLMEALAAMPTQLCIVLAMRADFVGKCFEQAYSGLASQVQAHLVPVIPMTRTELTDAICEPARRAHLTLEAELVQQLLTDVERSPGNLPLLQYTLTELWKQRQDNTLQLRTYAQLGGVTGTLEQRADAVYASLTPPQQATARHIFINLTQLGEGTEDTRRRVLQSTLVNPQHPEATVAIVIKRLADENLIVTNELVSKATGKHQPVVDVAHEALIRHWKELRKWLDENRTLIYQKQRLEASAFNYYNYRRQGFGSLLQGEPLKEAKNIQQKCRSIAPLSNQANQYINLSSHHEWCQLLKYWLIIICSLLSGSMLHAEIKAMTYNLQVDDNNETGNEYQKSQAIEYLVGGCSTRRKSLPVALYSLYRLYEWTGAAFCRNLDSRNLQDIDLSTANLSDANFSRAIFIDTNLHSVNLSSANLSGALLSNTSLEPLSSSTITNFDKSSTAPPISTESQVTDFSNLSFSNNVIATNLSNTNFNRTILLGVDLRNTVNLTIEQLSGDNPSLLCNVALPVGFDAIAPNRDCEILPPTLVERFGFSAEEAQRIVDEAMAREWD